MFYPGCDKKTLKKRKTLWLAFFGGLVIVLSYTLFHSVFTIIVAIISPSLKAPTEELLEFDLNIRVSIVGIFIVSALALYFLIDLMRIIRELEKQEAIMHKEMMVFKEKADIRTEDAFVMEVKNILKNNFDNNAFKINDLCSELAVSRAQLYRKFKSSSNVGICEYLKILRLNKALELLFSSDLNVTQVAFSAGFKNLSHFNREFFLMYGETPKKMQKTDRILLDAQQKN